jgi:hypothetical protein
LRFFIQLYEVEREVRELDAAQRNRIRQERARPVADALHLWLAEQRKKVPEGSATAKAIDYPPTTTGWRTRSGRLRWGARTGCSPGHYAPAK